ncbi:hypothetical protein BVX98_04975 [bacterium F11]|nr:hypothetical protein BVX98_04975 [bacterium F11]
MKKSTVKSLSLFERLLFVALMGILILTLRPLSSLSLLFSREEAKFEFLYQYDPDKAEGDAQLSVVEGDHSSQKGVGQIQLNAYDGRLEISLDPNRTHLTTLHVSAWSTTSSPLRLVLYNTTTDNHHLLMDRSVILHQSFELTPYLNKGHHYKLILRSALRSDSFSFALDEFVVQQSVNHPIFPRWDSFLTGLLLLIFILYTNPKKATFRIRPVLLGVVCGGLLLFKINPLWDHFYQHWLLLGALGLLVWYRQKNKSSPFGYLGSHEWVIPVLAFGFSLRWNALGGVMGIPLEGDALGYYQLVSDFSWIHPLSTGIREPFYIWIQTLFSIIVGLKIFTFRFLALVFSVGIIGATYGLAFEISKKKFIAVMAALLMAFGNFSVHNAIRGERSELFLLILIFFLVFSLKLKKEPKNEWKLGILVGMLSLTWLIGLIPGVLVYGYRVYRLKIQPKYSLQFLIIVILFVLPHFLAQWATTGDPFTSINVHTKYYRNARLSADAPPAGENKSLFHFVFIEEGPSLVVNVVKGYANLFLNPFNPFNKIFLGFHYTHYLSVFLYPFLLIGLLFSVLRREVEVFVLLFGVLNLSVGFLDQVRDPRLFLQAAPFVAYFFGVGVEVVKQYMGSRQRPHLGRVSK